MGSGISRHRRQTGQIPARTMLLLALALGAANCSRPIPEPEPEPPRNIFLLVVDTLRRDHVSAHGGSVRTPNIDRIARRGQVIAEAVSSFHQTTMSMGALFTGRTPSLEWTDGDRLDWNGKTWCGLTRFARGADDDCIPSSLPTLAEGMRALGYRTIGVVANELLYEPGGYRRGFDEWREVARAPFPPDRNRRYALPRRLAISRRASKVNAEVLKVLEAQPEDQPLFVYVHYIDVHEYGVLKRPYAKAVELLDADIGRLLEALEEKDLLRDSLIVLTSDHGEELYETHALETQARAHFGNPSFEPVLRVPLVSSQPLLQEGEALVRSQDLYGLLLQAAGAVAPPPRDTERDELFVSEHDFQTYRRGRWKSTRRRDGKTSMLFDLQTDPGEKRDVSDSHPGIVAEHQARMDQLGSSLAATGKQSATLSESDAARLRALGYLE